MHKFFYGNGESNPDDDPDDDTTSGGDSAGSTHYSTSDPVPASLGADLLAAHGLAIVRTGE